MHTTVGGRPPLATPVPKQSAAGTLPATSSLTPSIAQFAINQTVNKSNNAAPVNAANRLGEVQGTAPKAVGIYKDPDTGVFVTMLRDPTSGKIDQYPTEKALELYAWLDKQTKPTSCCGDVNIKA